MKKLTALILVCMLLVTLCGCSEKTTAKEISADITPNEVPEADLSASNTEVTDFSFRLFNQCLEPTKNVMISPFSVLCALAMTANGTDGETRSQLEDAFGLSTQELNSYIHTYMQQLPNAEKYRLSIANSIWFRDDFSVNQDFLQTNADYYDAEVQQLRFDKKAADKINTWCAEKTENMIPKLLEDISDDTIMYLINAVAFLAEWEAVYESDQIEQSVFTKADGAEVPIELMRSTEELYFEDDSASGFLKYYADRSYAFAALLPNEGISAEEYAATLTGEHFAELLVSASSDYEVHAGIPKFESEYDVSLVEHLKRMGVTNIFEDADFSRLSDSADLSVSEVLHKTFISVDEKGTKAAAVTMVAIAEEAPSEPRIKEVILDRPFLYAIIDCENNIPLFIGIMNDPS